MNRDQVKGTAKDIAGKVQEKVGQVTGSASQQAKGVAKQVEGKVQKGVGNVEQAIKDTDKKTRP
ncbi:MAG: CsbD family protein [Betaproteobacteria bacterium]